MKIDRLIAITMYLLRRKTVSASALAERFEVSKRTIQRDIEALCKAGIPVASSYGPDGGYAIMEGFKLGKRLGDAEDGLSIVAALKGLSSAHNSEIIRATLDKALHAMNGGKQRVFVDFGVARERAGIGFLLKQIDEARFLPATAHRLSRSASSVFHASILPYFSILFFCAVLP